MPRRACLSLAALLMLALTGCASYSPAVDKAVRDIPPEKIATAKAATDGFIRSAVLVERMSRLAVGVCTQKGQRLPFDMAINPQLKDADLRAALKAVGGWDAQPKLIALVAEAAPHHGKYVARVNGEPIKAGDVNTAHWAAVKAVNDGKLAELEFTDGSKWAAAGTTGCFGRVALDAGGFARLTEVSNMGLGFEGLPFSWYSVASSDEEWAFVVSRSLYFTSDGGKSRLTVGLLTGAAANGLVKGLTFGISALVFDARVSVVGAVRRRYLSEADLFGLQVLDAAGMDVDKALAFAQRMSQEQALPSDLTELHFSAERLLALNTEASRLKAARLVAPAQ